MSVALLVVTSLAFVSMIVGVIMCIAGTIAVDNSLTTSVGYSSSAPAIVMSNDQNKAALWPTYKFLEALSGSGLGRLQLNPITGDPIIRFYLWFETLLPVNQLPNDAVIAISDHQGQTAKMNSRDAPFVNRVFVQDQKGPSANNNVTEQQLLTTSGKGSLTIPAGSFEPGFSLLLRASGTIGLTGMQRLQLRVKQAEGAVSSPDVAMIEQELQGLIPFVTVVGTQAWSLEVILTAQQTSNTLSVSTTWNIADGPTVVSVQNGVAITNSVNNSLTLTAQWETASDPATAQMMCHQYVIQELL